MSRQWNPIWPFTEEQRIINLCAMQDLPPTLGPTRLLRVTTPYFCAGAVWQKIGGAWSCIHTAPILHWMAGMRPGEAKLALLKMGADYQFVESQSPTGLREQEKTVSGNVGSPALPGPRPNQPLTGPLKPAPPTTAVIPPSSPRSHALQPVVS